MPFTVHLHCYLPILLPNALDLRQVSCLLRQLMNNSQCSLLFSRQHLCGCYFSDKIKEGVLHQRVDFSGVTSNSVTRTGSGVTPLYLKMAESEKSYGRYWEFELRKTLMEKGANIIYKDEKKQKLFDF